MANKQASSNKINLILIGCHAGCYLAGTAEIGSSFLPFFLLSLYFLSLPSLPTFSLYLLSFDSLLSSSRVHSLLRPRAKVHALTAALHLVPVLYRGIGAVLPIWSECGWGVPYYLSHVCLYRVCLLFF